MLAQVVWRFGAFELDESLFELRHNGVVVPLQRRAFDLLHYLIKRRDVVVSKKELLDRVWGGAAVTDDSLPKAIMAVRLALGEDSDRPTYIQTVRGRGYRFTGSIDTARGPVASVESQRRPPIVGREAIAADMRTRIINAMRGRGSLLLLTGDVGVGKTSLLEELDRMASDLSQVCAVAVQCPSHQGAPELWPFRQVLHVLRDRSLPLESSLEGFLETSAGRQGLRTPEERYALFESILRALAKFAQRAPLVLTIDDLHLADGNTLALMESLTPRVRKLPLFVATACRPSAQYPALRATLGVLARERSMTTITLEPLACNEVARLLEHSLGTAPSEALLDRVFDKTRGNPLLVTELVHVLRADQELRMASASTSALLGGDAMREAIIEHIRALPDSVARVLTAASVFGRSFPLAPLARSLGVSNASVLAELDLAEAARMVARCTPGEYRFTYPLIRDALYKRLPISERARFHAAAGAALENHLVDAANATAVAEIARHFVLASPAGDAARAVGWCLRAVAVAEGAGDRAIAVRCAQLGLDALRYSQEPLVEERARLLAACGRETEPRRPRE